MTSQNPKPALGSRPEFLEGNVFPAQDAVHIKPAQLYLFNVVGGEELLDFVKGHGGLFEWQWLVDSG